MSEIQKNTPDAPKSNFDQQIDEALELANASSDREILQTARNRAQSIVEAEVPIKPKEKSSTGKKIGAGVVAGLLAGSGVTIAVADTLLPQEIVSVSSGDVDSGEGVGTAVDEALGFLKQSDVNPASVDQRQNVIDQAFDIHSDENGYVQAGTVIAVAQTKSPIFGTTGYQAIDLEKTDEN